MAFHAYSGFVNTIRKEYQQSGDLCPHKATNWERRKCTDQTDQAILKPTTDLQASNQESQFPQETWAAGCAQKAPSNHSRCHSSASKIEIWGQQVALRHVCCYNLYFCIHIQYFLSIPISPEMSIKSRVRVKPKVHSMSYCIQDSVWNSFTVSKMEQYGYIYSPDLWMSPSAKIQKQNHTTRCSTNRSFTIRYVNV